MRVRDLVCLWIASAALLSGCKNHPSADIKAPAVIAANIVESHAQQMPVDVVATGSLHARESAVISAQVSGRVLRVLVHEGDQVQAGQTLLLLDDALMHADYDQAQAAAVAAEKQQAAAQADASLAASTLARYQQLQAEKSVSPQEMDEVTRRAQAATARLDALRAQTAAATAGASGAKTMLGYTHLRAPFAGVVTARMVDPGTQAMPGVSLLQVDSRGPLQLLASVDESVIGSVHQGMKVPVTVGGIQTQGTVSEILPDADMNSHSFQVKVNLLPMEALHAGMYGSAAIANGVRQAVVLQRSAIVMRGSLACVYVLDTQNIAQLRYITLGKADGNLVEVLSGISAGEKIVDQPADRDLAGNRIEARQ